MLTFESFYVNGLNHCVIVGADGGGCEMSTYDSDTAGGGSVQGAYPLLAWDQHQADQWRTLYNDRYENL